MLAITPQAPNLTILQPHLGLAFEFCPEAYVAAGFDAPAVITTEGFAPNL